MKTQHHHLHFFTTATTLLFLLLPQTTTTTTTTNTDFIRTHCTATLYPDICYTSLSNYTTTIQQNSAKLTQIAISLSLTSSRHMASYLSTLSLQSGAGRATASALHDCVSNFADAVDQISGSLKQMRRLGKGGEAFRFEMSNVQTWMSAALTDEETCTDGFEDVVEAGKVKTDVWDRVAEVKKYTSIALALVNSYEANGYH